MFYSSLLSFENTCIISFYLNHQLSIDVLKQCYWMLSHKHFENIRSKRQSVMLSITKDDFSYCGSFNFWDIIGFLVDRSIEVTGGFSLLFLLGLLEKGEMCNITFSVIKKFSRFPLLRNTCPQLSAPCKSSNLCNDHSIKTS